MTENERAEVPNPGTREAFYAGCTCAVMDNHHGQGYRGRTGVFVYTVGCPVHKPEPHPAGYHGGGGHAVGGA